MPGIPLVAREISSYSRSTDQMCHEDSRMHLSAEEEIAAEESLTIYCKPVELYNILQRRARKTPLFIQRCLSYQIHEKHSRRIQMTLSLSETVNEGLQARCPFPLYILLGRLVSDTAVAEYSAVYRFSRACILTNFTGVEGSTQVQANFVLPEISRLALKTKSGTLAILLVNFAGNLNPSSGTDLSKGRLGMKSVPSNDGGYCLLGKIPLESLYRSWEKYPNLSLGQRAELTCPVDMHSCFLKLSCLNKDKCVSIQMPFSSGTSNFVQQVHITIFAEEVGGKDKSPYNSYRSSDVSSPSLSRILRLRAGNVVFNYRYYNNKLQRTEVTEDFSCPFCLVKCASFKGLRYHLRSSHDLFHFEFWVTEEYQAVNVSVKTDIWKSEIVADGIDPKQQTFFYCSKQRRHRRLRNLLQQSKHVHPLVLKSNLPSGVGENDVHNASIGAAECAHVPASFNVAGVSNAAAEACNDPECIQSISGNNFVPPSMLQFAKTRKLSIERSDSRNHTLLQKRQFFHSHRAQPMAWEQVEADRDSEDEVDDDVADLEDRRMLDDFVDVTKDEKQMMHMWNSFVRRQRVLADGHIPWACEAFTKLHGHDLVRAPSLIWCWRLFMMKLWNQGLLDARTMNTCNIILERYNKDKDNDKDKDVSDPIPI